MMLKRQDGFGPCAAQTVRCRADSPMDEGFQRAMNLSKAYVPLVQRLISGQVVSIDSDHTIGALALISGAGPASALKCSGHESLVPMTASSP